MAESEELNTLEFEIIELDERLDMAVDPLVPNIDIGCPNCGCSKGANCTACAP